MTTLNTIIEEEKTTAEQLDEIALSRVTSINGVLVQMWDRNVLSAYIDGKLATAMQRAYEAGAKDFRSLISSQTYEWDGGEEEWSKHLDQLKKEIKR